MPLQPRFRHVPGRPRPFVDREGPLDTFRHELSRVGGGPRVLNLTGIGGIGKSRLLREFGHQVQDTHRTASLDLQVPALRQQDAALAVLRAELGRQKVRFDHYDVAYTVLWQRLHPHLKVSRRELPFVEESEVLTEILDSAAGLPVFGTAVGLLKLAHSAPSRLRERRALRRSSLLQDLDSLSNTELADAVTYLFADDLRASAADGRPYVVFIDAYEALVGEHARTGAIVLSDAWLRDLVAQLDQGLCVIASREPARWEEYDPDWVSAIKVSPLSDLPMNACLELLEQRGIIDPQERRGIAAASRGVPFYLNLAADTGGEPIAAVSTDQILERFLHHVRPEEVQLLELLSLARTFDRGVFDALAAEYRLPAHQLAWESLVGYSFVQAARAGQFQLHQLMIGALRSRVSAPVAMDVHRALRRHWDSRTTVGSGRPPTVAIRALQEAAHHALRSGEVSGDELLGYADQLVALGGAAGVRPLVTDAAQDAAPQSAGIPDAVRCLQAEAAYLLGTPEHVATDSVPVPAELGTHAQIRLAVATAHAKRVRGLTSAALLDYSTIHTHGRGRGHLSAGLWAADLHMAQGRFREAVDLVAEVRSECAEADELLADAARLLHLTHRFAFDFETAARFLDEAADRYTAGGSVIGIANVQTNRAEQLAWTAPELAVDAAERAIEQQTEIGALHEIGKSRTALALACTRLGDMSRAEAEFDLACADLDRARYRSGRARAELYRAALMARLGRVPAMVSSVTWAVQEFELTEVYPTMIIGAATTLDRIGHPIPAVSEAAERARRRIHPIESQPAMQQRIDRWMSMLVANLR